MKTILIMNFLLIAIDFSYIIYLFFNNMEFVFIGALVLINVLFIFAIIFLGLRKIEF
jgi:hypothetical protein